MLGEMKLCKLSASSLFLLQRRCSIAGCNCDVTIDECASSPCQNGATCNKNELDKYTCSCAAGFHDFNCNSDVNECYSKPCKNGATCDDSSTTKKAKVPVKDHAYRCTCVAGFGNGMCGFTSTSGPCPEHERPPILCRVPFLLQLGVRSTQFPPAPLRVPTPSVSHTRRLYKWPMLQQQWQLRRGRERVLE